MDLQYSLERYRQGSYLPCIFVLFTYFLRAWTSVNDMQFPSVSECMNCHVAARYICNFTQPRYCIIDEKSR